LLVLRRVNRVMLVLMESSISEILDHLEGHYGKLEASWPEDPYHYLVWLHCGYPPSEERCAKGWTSLLGAIGSDARAILAASPAELSAALETSGALPEERAMRLKDVASRVVDEFAGDLRGALSGSPERARKLLKSFPGIADPGADRIVLFARIQPVAAVPSNCPHVLLRIVKGGEGKNYAATYREAQAELQQLPEDFESRIRAFLLLKRHGQEVCKAARPRCEECPVRESCRYGARR